MRLVGNSGPAVELRITGYQFPGNHTSEYDSNWLMVEGRVSHPRGGWSFCDPCLLTYEAVRLGDWLEAVARGLEAEPEVGFIEPNLSFAVASSGGVRVLRVSLALEARPPWAAQGEDVVLELPVAELNLTGAVRAWREQLQEFPQRAER
jgi:hypothetical protein